MEESYKQEIEQSKGDEVQISQIIDAFMRDGLTAARSEPCVLLSILQSIVLSEGRKRNGITGEPKSPHYERSLKWEPH